MRIFLFFLLSLPGFTAVAQNIAINTSGAAAASTNMLEVTQSNTAAYMVALYAINSGANAATDTGYAFKAIKTGATGNNVAGYFSATGGALNYAIIVPKNRGYMGLGTVTPKRVLHIENSDARILTFDFDSPISWTRPAWEFGSFGANFQILSTHDYTTASALTRLYVGADGLVGIGTAAPAALLHVNPTYTVNTDTKSIQSGLTYNGAAAMANWYGHYIAAPTGTGAITTKYALVTEAAAGNVGIGTTAPGSQLHTTGTVRFANYPSGFLSTDASGIIQTPRSIAVSGTGVAVTNGNGVSGNPTLNLSFGSLSTAPGGTTPLPTGNFGQFQAHGTYTDFNTTPAYWGWNYVQGSTNGPNATSSQWYRQVISLGSEYIGRGAGGYSLEMAYPRFSASTAGIWMRTVENGVFGAWTRVDGMAASNEWTDEGSYLRPADGITENVTIGRISASAPFSTSVHKLLVYSGTTFSLSGSPDWDANDATVKFYSDANCNSTVSNLLDLQFGNATALSADDKFIKFTRGLTEVGSINSEVVYTTFTGAHIGQSDEDGSRWIPGMIVSSHGNPSVATMGRALVKIGLTKIARDPAAIGVFSSVEFKHNHADMDTSRPAYQYNALGEGLILVTDLGGDIAIGDYITSSSRPGYGMKQDDDLLHNYTVAKATDSVKWAEVAVDPKYGFKWKLVACTYHGG